MSPAAAPSRKAQSGGTAQLNADLLQAAYAGNIEGVKEAVANGAEVDIVHQQTGLTALHIAVGTNNLPLTKYLLEVAGAKLAPDRSGRWPTVIAAECRTGEELCDYIVEAEAKAMSS